jgi:AraC-like DNA-binding protein
MSVRPRASTSDRTLPALGRVDFSESAAWSVLGSGWQHLHGDFRELGYSIEWHDFTTTREFDWTGSFHPGGLEICLNLSGRGRVESPTGTLDFAPRTAGFYVQDEPGLRGSRAAGEHHQFITVELSLAFLQRHLLRDEKNLHPHLRGLGEGTVKPQVSPPVRLTSEHQQLVMTLRKPPVYAAAQRLWYHAKALEVAAAFFYQPSNDDDLFCQRQKRQNQDRVQRVVALLRENLAEPLSLEEIGRRVGCSHFHLSRIFTQETGKSIFQKLRELRLDRAAELLREGKMNVTQVSMEVGYSSPSHFSAAFHEAFGCCPGLYPLPIVSPQVARKRRA